MASYARVAVARSAGGFTVSSQTVTPVANIEFPMASTGSTVATHIGFGLASSGSTQLLYFAALTPNITITNGVIPRITTATTIVEAASDSMGNAAATDLLKIIFNNTTWALVGDATGIVGSTVAGSLYCSLHTASPAEAGTQATSEVTYT